MKKLPNSPIKTQSPTTFFLTHTRNSNSFRRSLPHFPRKLNSRIFREKAKRINRGAEPSSTLLPAATKAPIRIKEMYIWINAHANTYIHIYQAYIYIYIHISVCLYIFPHKAFEGEARGGIDNLPEEDENLFNGRESMNTFRLPRDTQVTLKGLALGIGRCQKWDHAKFYIGKLCCSHVSWDSVVVDGWLSAWTRDFLDFCFTYFPIY